MFLMNDGMCLPIMEDIPSTGKLSNMLHSQHDTKSKNHRETNYWRKLHQKTYYLMMKMTALCPLPGLIGQIAWATLFQGVALQAATEESDALVLQAAQ